MAPLRRPSHTASWTPQSEVDPLPTLHPITDPKFLVLLFIYLFISSSLHRIANPSDKESRLL